MIYVVGSGPAGVSCAMALVKQGHEVTMLDAGIELEPEREAIVREMATRDPAEWDSQSIAIIRDNMAARASGVPLKYSYGSDFPYREVEHFIPISGRGIGIQPSLAKGGFSNVWGAAMLPYLGSDITDWPLTPADLAPHYRAVLELTGLAATNDDLASHFPLYSESFHQLPASRQIEGLSSDLRRHRTELLARGILAGRSRLAVARHSEENRACAACGLCMYGCPYGLIYNSAATLSALERFPNFKYAKGVIVRRFSETGTGVTITGRSLCGNEPLSYTGSRLYLAAGVLSTTRLFLESIEAYDHALTLRDSQYFLLPWLRYRGVPGVRQEQLHTLSQAFIEVFDSEVSERSIHLQVYSYNDLYARAFESMLGPAEPLLRAPINALLKRFLLIQGYLHSDLSATVSVKLERAGRGGESTLTLEPHPSSRTRGTLKKLVSKLRANRKYFQAVPLSPMMKVGLPGRGFHSGGTLPMRANAPGPFESDLLGRPHNLSRVHCVDATTFPSIPASTITLTAMANAHRIGSHQIAGE